MPKSNDPVIVIIKGHLLVEEALFTAVSGFCRRPEAIENARLSFAHLLALYSGLTGQKEEGHIYKFIKATNELRNKLAHNADVPELEKKIDALLAIHTGEPVTSKNARVRAGHLKVVFAFTCGTIHGTGEGFNIANGRANHLLDRPAAR